MYNDSGFEKGEGRDKRTFIGYVAEYLLDDGSKGIILLSEEGDEYYVIPNKQADRLKAFVDEEVVATGDVTTDETGDAYISVRGFEAMEYDDRSEDDYEYDVY